jgi:hypothetical protein
MTEDSTEYPFTPSEATVVRQAAVEASTKIDVLNSLIRLIVSQQGLTGSWGLKQDASGIMKQPDPSAPPQPPA